MKSTTSVSPSTEARTPERIESAPRLGPIDNRGRLNYNPFLGGLRIRIRGLTGKLGALGIRKHTTISRNLAPTVERGNSFSFRRICLHRPLRSGRADYVNQLQMRLTDQ